MTTETAPATALRGIGLHRTFPTPAGDVHACRDVSLELHPGELLVLRGPSGSGKTTLLNLLGGLDRPTAGTVLIGDQDLADLSEARLVDLRRRRLGYVFQSFGLISVLSAAENVEVPLRLLEVEPREREERVAAMLERVGLDGSSAQRPEELSGGQQQRVGLARALVARPDILIADEPTGQLDSATAASMMALVHDLVRSDGVAAVVSTHDPLMVSLADRVLELHDGAIRAGSAYTSRHAAPEKSLGPRT